MKLVLLFYSDFGSRKGKGIEAYYAVKEAWKRGYLARVITRDKVKDELDFDMNLVERAVPLGNVIPRALVGLGKYVVKGLPSRLWGERLVDTFASRRLDEGDILYSTLRMVKSLTKAKQLGLITVLYAAQLHPQWNLQILEEEHRRWGIDIHSPSWSASMMSRTLESVNLADYLITLSSFSKQTYVSRGYPEDRIFVNPLGVDLERFQPDFSKSYESLDYLFVGNISIIKGIQYLLEAWRQLHLQDAKLLICGAIHRGMRSLIESYRRGVTSIEYIGYVKDPAMYYRQSSIFILPSLSEGFPRVVLEAMASGLPIIATTPASEAVRDGEDGFVIPARDVEALKEKMLYFYDNRDEIERMGRNARQQAERYTWDAYSLRTVKILEDIWKQESR